MNNAKSNRRIGWLGTALFAMLTFVIRVNVPPNGPTTGDESVAKAIQLLFSPAHAPFWKMANRLGSTVPIICLTLLLFIIFMIKIGWRKAIWLPVVVAASYAMNALIKNAVHRDRPEQQWGIVADGFSFPSGNAMLAMTLYGTAALMASIYLVNNRTGRIVLWTAAILIILILGLSRLYFRVHYATDILAGYSAGIAAMFAYLALQTYRFGPPRYN